MGSNLNPLISIIVGYRNREIKRVKNSLDSLAKQSYPHFEVIFIDYGSEEEVAEQAKQSVISYGCCEYIYSNTRGWFWNRSHALNTGIKKAKGEVLLIYDIDLIIEADFLEKIAVLDYNEQFYTFSCFYLPEHFNFRNTNLLIDGIHYEQNYVGLCAVAKRQVFNIKGFDEYYMVWGVEDDDFYERLASNGLFRKQMSVIDYRIFHQWHVTHSPVKPTLWYLTMMNHLFATTRGENHGCNWGVPIGQEDRPILKLINKSIIKESPIKFEFWKNEKLLFFNLFIRDFYHLSSGKTASLEYNFHQEEKHKCFRKRNFSLFGKGEIDKDRISKTDIINFLQFFVGINRMSLLDYYFEADGHILRFYCTKHKQ